MIESIKPETGYVDANKTSFYYELAGAGEPLILIHAGITDRRLWDNQFNDFARHYRVIRYDGRGYGHSASSNGGYSRSEDLHALLLALDIEQAHLLGCSQGGTTAIDFALDYPEMVKRLILVSATPNGYQFEGEPPPKLLAFIGAYQQQNLVQAAELATQVWFDGPQRQPHQLNPETRNRVKNIISEVLSTGTMDITGETSAGRPAVDRLGDIRVPTLIIAGDQDDPAMLEAAGYLAANIPGAQKTVIQDTAHLPNIEQPEAFNQVVLNFLKH
jgi:pimeloyl-ACP methyl ester carboxylesterase